MSRALVALYLATIALANITTAALGPSWSIVVAFALVGVDLTTRDALHRAWRGDRLVPRMALLIAAGGVISLILVPDSGRIALASCVAFVAAAIADTVVYALLEDRPQRVRVNGSNAIAAGVDSVLFVALAFGFPLLPLIIVGQWVAKVAGGALWLEVMRAVSVRRATA